MIKTEREIYVWGAGQFGGQTLLNLQDKGIKIKGLIDKNAKQIKTRYKLPVLEPNIALQNKKCKIIIAIKDKCSVKEIIETLLLAGKKRNMDFEVAPSSNKKSDKKIKEFNKLIFFTQNKFNTPLSCTSQLCNQYFWKLPFYQYWCEQLKVKPVMNRKQWEWVYVAQVLFENGFLKPGNKGLCFAAGQEPLPALFASLGCKITATDLDINSETAKIWKTSNQNTENNVKILNKDGICPNDLFKNNVRFRSVNMNEIPNNLRNFDFNWSCCAFEHIGGIKQGLDFLINNLETLKPGGIAVHTSEFNLSSNEDTFESRDLCIFREKDYRKTVEKLEKMGHYVYPLDLKKGNEPLDNYVDTPPYRQDFHLRLFIEAYVSTSIGIIVKKGK